MNAVVPTLSSKYAHPAFQGLGEKPLMALFNGGVVRVLTPQTAVFRSGEPATADVLLLEGTLKLSGGQSGGQLIPLAAGDYLPAALLAQDGLYCHSASMTSAGTVLMLDAAAWQELDEGQQLALHRNLLPLTQRLLGLLRQSSQPPRGSAQVSVERVQAYMTQKQTAYQDAGVLKTMLANLPRLPHYTTKLTTLLNDPKANTRTIVEIARQDPSLTAAVLKTVNSPYFGLRHKIKDFQHAVMMLGFTQIQQLLMSTGVQSTMPNTPEFRQLQAHSMMISVLANEISLTLKVGSPPVLSTLGILHDIGKSVVLLLRRQFAKQDFLMGLLDPDMVGTLLLQEWQLPEHISEPLRHQSFPELLPPALLPAAHRTSISVLHLAHQCLERLRNLQAEAPSPCPTRDYLAELGCRDPSLDAFLFTRLIPAALSRGTPLPLALQDMLKKAQSLEASGQLKVISTPP